jgi:hypothetical protein
MDPLIITRHAGWFEDLHSVPRVDFSETFMPVVKPATIRTVLTIAVSNHRPTHQLDVSNAFLHGNLRD